VTKLTVGRAHPFGKGFVRLTLRWAGVEGTGRCLVIQGNHGLSVDVPGTVRLNEILDGSLINNATTLVEYQLERTIFGE
jgi:hypothetical protein